MSNNNHPHGHLSQPAQNPSWNPLQIPSYIPRQPQLAHMSNERAAMVRSPLAWHATAQPPDAIYNFMSANHKNLEHHQMNPLLAPPYVSGTLPFDSMDLSLQSSRSATSPLHKAHGMSQQQQPVQQAQQQHLHTTNNYAPIHNLSTNPSAGAHVQHVSTLNAPASQHTHGVPPATPPSSSPATAVSAKYLNANGGDCESLLPPTSVSTSSSNSNAGGSYMQTNREDSYTKTMSQLKRTFEHETKTMQKPVELVNKDCNYATPLPANKLPTHSLQQQHASSKKNSPLRNYQHQQQHHQQQPYSIPPTQSATTNIKYNGPHTPPTPHSPVMQQSPLLPLSTQHQLQQQQSPTGSGPIDYNQLHLQHHMHSSQHVINYAQQHLAPTPHQQQQQQNQTQHANYVQHNQALLSQHSHTHHVQQHLPVAQLVTQQPPPQQHLQQIQTQSRTSVPSSHIQHAQLDSLSVPKSEDQPIITDLSSSTASMYRNATPVAPADAESQNITRPDPSESPFTGTSNEESLESNSNSSNSRVRRKRKSSQVMRLTPIEKPAEVHCEQQSPPQHTPNRCNSNSRSPKQSPMQGKSPRSAECSNFSLNLTASPSKPDNSIVRVQNPNGCEHEQASIPMQATNEAETISKIAEMIAKTGNEHSNSNSNSNCSSVYTPESSCSPKTKKQPQVIQRNNLENDTVLQNCSNDNGDVCDNIEKETTTPKQSPAPPSPHSNSNSSSSSSSSSTSHSTNASRSECKANDTVVVADTPASPPSEEKGAIPSLVQPIIVEEAVESKEEPTISVENMTPPSAELVVAPIEASPVKATNFEEVENKLEEMFAGIEDEPPTVLEETETVQVIKEPIVTISAAADVAHDLSFESEIAANNNLELETQALKKSDEQIAERRTQSTLVTPEVRPLATKAAMKSTMPSPPATPTAETMNDETATSETLAVNAKALPPKRLPPRRRLSVGMDAAFLRISMDAETISSKRTAAGRKKPKVSNKEISITLDDDKPSTSAAAAAALAARAKEQAAVAEQKQAEITVVNVQKQQQQQQQQQERTTTATNVRKKTVAKGKKPNVARGGAKNGAKTNSKQSKQRRKAYSTDEESMHAVSKESNGAAAAAATAAAVSAVEPKYKSPYIVVKLDGSITVINTPTSEDVSEKQAKVKKPSGYAHERKNIRGMHSSTLSNRYDADTTDSTWICVFCKNGPHRMGLGDLFGPYLVTTDCEEYRAALKAPGVHDLYALFVNKRNRADMVQARERNLPVVPATLAAAMQAQISPKSMHKRKRKLTDELLLPPVHVNNDVIDTTDPHNYSIESELIRSFRGMIKTSEKSFEVWLHEDCATWAPGVFLVGARTVGLDAAIWDSTRYVCGICSYAGAIVCCLQRDCKIAAHVPCARQAQWSLNESNMQVYCQLHAHNVNKPTAQSKLSTFCTS